MPATGSECMNVQSKKIKKNEKMIETTQHHESENSISISSSSNKIMAMKAGTLNQIRK